MENIGSKLLQKTGNSCFRKQKRGRSYKEQRAELAKGSNFLTIRDCYYGHNELNLSGFLGCKQQKQTLVSIRKKQIIGRFGESHSKEPGEAALEK